MITLILNKTELESRVYGKPGTPEQPGSAGTALFLRLESRANTIMPLIEKTLQ